MKNILRKLMGIVFVLLTLTASMHAELCTAETIALDSNVSSSWSADCNETNNGIVSYVKTYTFDLTTKTVISLDMVSNTQDAELGLAQDINGTLNLLASTQSSVQPLNIMRELEAGTYVVKVSSPQIDNFTLSLETVPTQMMHFSGSITIPTGLQNLYNTCSGSECPVMNFKVRGYGNTLGDTNITYNANTGTYDYNLTYEQIIAENVQDNKYEVSVYITNGDMGNENIYYSFGEDNAIGNVNNVVDGNDTLMHNRYDEMYNNIYKPLNIPLTQTSVNLDIDLSNKNDGRQKIVGKVKVPANIVELSVPNYSMGIFTEDFIFIYIYDSNHSGNNVQLYLSGTPDANGAYDFTTSIDYSEGNTSRFEVNMFGRLDGVYLNALYYQIAEDANDTDDHSIDGDEKLVDNTPTFNNYVEFNNAVGDVGTLDLDAYFDGSVMLTGVITPPNGYMDSSSNRISLQFTSGTNYWNTYVDSWNTEVNGTYAYNIRILASQMAEIEANGLSLNLYFYSNNTSSQYSYTFGDDRAVGGTGVNLDHAVTDISVTAQSLLLDFNATLPSVDINLSNFVLPAMGNVVVPSNVQPNVDSVNIVAHDVNDNSQYPITAYYDGSGLTLHGLKEGHNYAIEVTYNINAMPSGTVYMLNDDDGNFTNGGVFLEEARYVTNEQNMSVLDTATIMGGVDMTLSPFDFILPNQIIFEGNVILPESITGLMATCEGNSCPIVSVSVIYNMDNTGVSQTLSLPSGSYSMGISPMMVPTTKDENAYRVRVNIYNGNMGNETYYYDFGADNAISADDNISRNWSESTLKVDLNQSTVNLDINLSNKDEGLQQITGKIKLPAGMTLGDNGAGTWNSVNVNITPVIDDGVGNYMEDWNNVWLNVNQTPDENGSYTFIGSVAYDDTVGTRLKLSLNGNLNGENINLYYDVGLDANNTYDHIIDGDESLVANYLPADSHIYFAGAVADFGVIDVETYMNSSTLLTGTLTPPSDIQESSITLEFSSTDGAGFNYAENINLWFMDATETQNFSIRIPNDKYAGIEENNLSLNINFGSKTRAYSFEVPNKMLDEGESPSVAVPLVLDFNASMPVLNIDLSNYLTPGKQHVTGKIKLPAGMTLGDNGDGTWNSVNVNIMPVIDDGTGNYMEDWAVMGVGVSVSQTPDENGTYTFTGSVDYDDTIGSRLKLSLNGNLNGENINLYYMVGMDSNGTYDYTIDGNEALVDQYLPADSHIYFPGAVADFGVIDVETYMNASTLLTGTLTPPSDIQESSITLEFSSSDGLGFNYTENINLWFMNATETQNFSIRIPNDKYAGIEENNLTLNINFGSKTRAYSFEVPNRMLSEDEDPSNAVPLVLDFNASMPVLNIDLSSYLTPGRQQITGKIKLPAGMILGDSGAGTWNSVNVNIMPVMYDPATDSYWEDAMAPSISLSQTPDENGSYPFTGSIAYDDTRLKLSLSGDLNGENINLYYMIGADSNDTNDHSIDGDEHLVNTYLDANNHAHFVGAVADFGVIDVEAYYIANDHTAPVITLLGANPQTLERGSAYVELNATTDDGSIVDINSSAVQMDVAGTYSVTYNAVDVSGNQAVEVTREVVVQDTIIPVITLIGTNPQTLERGSAYVELNATIDDNITTIVINSSAVDMNTVGEYNVTYNAVDVSGNLAQEMNRTVIVEDTVAPVITLIGANPQTLERGSAYVELNATTDDGSIVDINSSAVQMDVAGTYSVTYNAVDVSGNQAVEVTREIVVQDTITPVITLIGANPQTLERGSAYVELNAIIDDNITNIIINSSAVDMNTVGEYNVTYNAVDVSGNLAQEMNRTVIVEDTVAPVITLIGANPQTLERGSEYVELNATIDDNITAIVIDSSAVDMNTVGEYNVTYNAVDVSGNLAQEMNRTVIVEDTVAPVITLIGANPQTLERGSAYVELNATTDDGSVVVIDSSAVDMNVSGTYTVIYTATDTLGNTAEANRTVEVSDTIVPVITLLGANPQTLERGEAYVELNATTDDGSPIVIDSSAIDMSVADTYIVTYTATDASGNTVEVNRTVEVNDTVSPVITLIGDNPQTLERGTAYVELNATVDDNITNIIIDSSAVDMNTVGEYNVTYNAVDASGNVAQEVNRTIIVEDTTAPVITLIGDNPQTLNLGTAYVELNATVEDNSTVIIDSSNVDMNVAGTYIVTYNATDTSGNIATEVTREVIVLTDTDGDGIPDNIDTDDDNDGVLDVNDDLPFNPNESVDTDHDGTGNNADRDDDNDGISDVDENKWGFDPLDASDGGNADADGDGVSNADEIEAGSDPLDPNDTKKPKRYAPIMMDDLMIMIPLED